MLGSMTKKDDLEITDLSGKGDGTAANGPAAVILAKKLLAEALA